MGPLMMLDTEEDAEGASSSMLEGVNSECAMGMC